MTDQLQRFLFEDTDIRGEITRLEQSYRAVLDAHPYPPAVGRLLGEFMAAVALLSATLKFDGTLTLQASSDGEIPLIMAEATSDRGLRAIARNADQARSESFNALLRDGRLAITITPRQGQRYQGIVALEGDSLASCLEGYFRQSEQLATRLWLHCDGARAAGLLLQELPANGPRDAESHSRQWQHVVQLADTLRAAELLELPFEECLHRLYHQDPVRLFAADALRFQCSCSAQRTLNALATLGREELESLLAEQGHIDINCEFCHQHYRYDHDAVQALFEPTLH